MSQDDDRALEAVAAALVSNKCHCEQCVDIRREQARKVITAYLSALPERELLAEALEALDRIVDFHIGDCPMTMEEIDFAKNINWEIRKTARTAADKIRAALDKGEPKP